MKLIKKISLASCLALLSMGNASGQPAPKPATTPGTALAVPPAPPPAAPLPDRTTASFGDWILRCDRRVDVTPAQRLCELAQTIQRAGDAGPQAQIALGRLAPADPIRFTALLPINIALQNGPKVTVEGTDRQSFDLTWVRCIASGCFANAAMGDDVLRKLRAQKEPGRLEYKDGAGRDVVLPISFGGFSQAFEAFVRESSN